MGPRAGLDRCGKSRPHQDSISAPSSPQPVAIPTELPGPPFFLVSIKTDWTRDFKSFFCSKHKDTRFQIGLSYIKTYVADATHLCNLGFPCLDALCVRFRRFNTHCVYPENWNFSVGGNIGTVFLYVVLWLFTPFGVFCSGVKHERTPAFCRMNEFGVGG